MTLLNKVSIVALVAPFIIAAAPMAALAASPAGVNLGSSGNFSILAKSGISTTGSTVVVGDIGVSPAPASYITGFALILPVASAFSTSAEVSGKVYASDYASPTSANLTTAILDMQNAYTDAAGRMPDVTELGAGTIGGLTLVPGVYKWGTSVGIPTDITLSGGANDVWIFEIAQNLTVSSAVKVVLSGGAQASNVFWVVAGQTTIGTTAVFNGNILDQTAIVLNTGATLNGRALAQTAVTLDSNSVTAPSSVSVTPTPVITPASVTTPASAPVSSPSNSSGVYTAPPMTTTINNTNTAVSSASTPAVSTSQIRAVAVNLYQGTNAADVTTLQQFLISQNTGSAAQALATVGATGYFGALTRAALAEFQTKVGISPALGNFGPITRSYISANE
ncbi:MAG TPA: ice-binding family protein [Candidatus Paceibacterota bacterium]